MSHKCNKPKCTGCKRPFRIKDNKWCYDEKYSLPSEIVRPQKINGEWTIEYEEN